MAEQSNRLRAAVQKLTEAIWNLDQIVPLSPELKDQYERIRVAREGLMKMIREERK